jgi:hypothetical protein
MSADAQTGYVETGVARFFVRRFYYTTSCNGTEWHACLHCSG